MFVTYPDNSTVAAFKRNGDSVPVHQQTIPTGKGVEGSNPVYADVSKDGKSLIVANYHGPDDGNNSKGAGVQTFTIGDDCHLKEADLVPHSGNSTNKKRQGAAHPHSAVVARNGMVFVCDLGMDQIFTYKIDASGKLTEMANTVTAPGSGPRHSMQHPTNDDILFVVSEMGSLVTSYKIEQNGALTQIANVSALAGLSEKGYGSKTAELAITKDGKHLYASNRAFDRKFNNTVAVFDVADNGNMTLAQQFTSPPFPRGMVLMPDGKHLLVASQTNGNVTSFEVDPKTGLLSQEKVTSTQKGPWGAAAFAILGTKSTTSEAASKEAAMMQGAPFAEAANKVVV
jgi:6-phosphogluconolactonase